QAGPAGGTGFHGQPAQGVLQCPLEAAPRQRPAPGVAAALPERARGRGRIRVVPARLPGRGGRDGGTSPPWARDCPPGSRATGPRGSLCRDHAQGRGMTGFPTLFYKELLRFWKVSFQTILAPVLTALLYLLIFSHVLEEHVQVYPGVRYTAFLVPGLVMMSLLQNAFANSSSSLIQSKVTGNIVF